MELKKLEIMIKKLTKKLKSLSIYAIMCSFFRVYWEETTVRISENEVLELGGFIIALLIVISSIFLLNHIGFICVFKNYT